MRLPFMQDDHRTDFLSPWNISGAECSSPASSSLVTYVWCYLCLMSHDHTFQREGKTERPLPSEKYDFDCQHLSLRGHMRCRWYDCFFICLVSVTHGRKKGFLSVGRLRVPVTSFVGLIFLSTSSYYLSSLYCSSWH